ncbi:MAG: DUF4054 domain-containing protein [Rickettsiales bacterium]|jgi:hypothetical protein|nr:DUF4054 domain-containing protein [Rickettsiales bacterium]
MTDNNRIIVNPVLFKKFFPEFVDVDDDVINFTSLGASTYISNIRGGINLNVELQERGVYLATAHLLKLDSLETNGGDGTTGGIVSATEGDVSASFVAPPVKNAMDFELNKTRYGQQLLIILRQCQPPMPRVQKNLRPYYEILK